MMEFGLLYLLGHVGSTLRMCCVSVYYEMIHVQLTKSPIGFCWQIILLSCGGRIYCQLMTTDGVFLSK
jgi:hypothetical protein